MQSSTLRAHGLRLAAIGLGTLLVTAAEPATAQAQQPTAVVTTKAGQLRGFKDAAKGDQRVQEASTTASRRAAIGALQGAAAGRRPGTASATRRASATSALRRATADAATPNATSR